MQEKRLGRGLRALIPAESEAPPSSELQLPVVQLRPSRVQPREHATEDGLAKLSASIREHGVLQPIVVRRSTEGYEIVAGERRWKAARLAGLDQVPVRVLDVSDDGRTLEIALVENIQREDLDAISKAKALRRLVEVFGLTQEQVAARVGMERTTIANHLRLLELPAEVIELVSRGTLSFGHARAILAAGTREMRLRLAARTVREELSVRTVETLAREEGAPRAKRTERGMVAAGPAWVSALEARLRESLGCRVQIRKAVGRAWTMTLTCSDQDELERVAANVGSA